ncbi:glycine zipper 2TM domain-containing protein [Acidovorax sp.]|uniref:glycine zipper 2TM domain-containing protein n=1 Tax=Acidovorax sp. TaxID=1872122 RepID=UPI0039193F5A
MPLIVSPSASSHPLAAGPVATAPHVTTLRWMWAAMAALAVCVLALGAALWAQTRPPASAAADSGGHPVAAAARTPEAEIIDEKMPPALMSKAPTAPKNVANLSAPPAAYAAPSQPVRAQPPLYAADRAPVVCATCGRVESVQAVQQAAPATGVGAVAGGVLGAVVGNQVGKGSGRTAATVLGAVGGGYVGHKVEERTRTQTVYQIAVRMEDGSLRRFTRAQPTAVGTPVVLQGKGFRVDDGAAARAAEPYPRAQPGAVRVADTY